MTVQVIGADGTESFRDSTQEEIDNQTVATERDIREEKIEEIKAEGLSRVQVVLPNVEDMDDVFLLKKLQGAFTPTADAITANSIYNYAVTKIGNMKTDPIATVQAYDPTTDPNWPS